MSPGNQEIVEPFEQHWGIQSARRLSTTKECQHLNVVAVGLGAWVLDGCSFLGRGQSGVDGVLPIMIKPESSTFRFFSGRGPDFGFGSEAVLVGFGTSGDGAAGKVNRP